MSRKKLHENGWESTPEAKAYRNQYNEEHYSRLFVRINKASRAEIDELAAGAGLSLPRFILQAVDAWKQLHNKD